MVQLLDKAKVNHDYSFDTICMHVQNTAAFCYIYKIINLKREDSQSIPKNITKYFIIKFNLLSVPNRDPVLSVLMNLNMYIPSLIR